MKIQTILSNEITDINSIDLSTLPEWTATEEDTTPPDSYRDADGIAHVLIKVDTSRQFMFINGNMMRFYDIDDSGSIDDEKEWPIIVKHWNMSEEERTLAHKAIRDEYLKTHSIEEWKTKGIK